MTSGSLPRRIAVLLLWWLPVSGFSSQHTDTGSPQRDEPAKIVLIIDDLGHWKSIGLRAASLPGPVACALLPHTPFVRDIAEQAHATGKEVMLHLPLAPIDNTVIAAGTIFMDSTQEQLAQIFALDLASVPHVVGVNNHMGSLLTQHPGHMTWLMTEIAKREPLFFVDSVTSEDSVALSIAAEMGIPVTRRDVFLDNEQTETAIARAFDKLKDKARLNGIAVGIGHPYPVTIEFLERELPSLADEGFELVSVSEAIRYRDARLNGELARP